MNARPTNHERIKSYLLGQLPEEYESQVGERLLIDPEFYEELSIVEEELIDQYLAGTLSDSDRQSFESYFILSSERQQQVRFAKALKKCVSVATDQNHPSRAGDEIVAESVETTKLVSTLRASSIFPFRGTSIASYATAVAILIVVIGGFLILVRPWQYPTTNGKVLAVELIPTPAMRDGSEEKQFTLTPDIESVRLQLDLLRNEYQSYEAVLRDSSPRNLVITKNLKPQVINGSPAVLMDVKADLLSSGDYRIHLNGIDPDNHSEGVATFSFTVRK